ncbi:MAG: aminotransferase class III-fold pyridoxal phosphate-dependent enzyme [Alphaproteobacteria bacterium]|nr:aminotransferase class III-fold pyridoxal phosphate-dependent enzyme [Alphaproteobacteria bacterium]
MPLTNAQTRDVEALIHPYTNLARHREVGPVILERGKGVRVFDSHGRDYIDAMAGLWCVSLGYSEERLVEAAAKQMRELPYSHIFAGRSHEPGIELAEKLKEVSPFAASKVFFANSGSEANDTQIKLAWYYWNAKGQPARKKIISRTKGYHGVTLVSASLTGLPNNHRGFDLPFAGILHADCPHAYHNAEAGESDDDFAARLACNLEALIEREGPETIAAFIAEPVMGAGGVIIPPPTYFDRIQPVLEKYDILFIDDEVICGFGRTGNYWGAQTYNMRPHTLSCAKALSSAYLPISAMLMHEEMYQAMLDQSRAIGTFGHGFTYSAHPVAAAVAVETLKIYEERNILAHVRRMTPAFAKRIAKLREHPIVGEAVSVGLLGGVELVADKTARTNFPAAKAVGMACAGFAQEEGIFTRAMLNDRLAFCPPLIITEAEIDEMFDKFTRALDKTEEMVRREKLRG